MLPWEKVTHFVILKQMWSFYWKTAPWIQSLTIVLGIHGKLVLKEYICFKLKKNNGEKGASKPMIQVLWTLFWSFVLGVFIYINVARSMEMSLLVISSPSFPLEDSNARKICWSVHNDNWHAGICSVTHGVSAVPGLCLCLQGNYPVDHEQCWSGCSSNWGYRALITTH